MKFALKSTVSLAGILLCVSLISKNVNAKQNINTVKLQPPPAPYVISGTKQSVTPKANAVTSSADQVVMQSREISSYGPSWQTFSDYLSVAKGCDQIPLSITFVNGVGASPKFQDLRISLAGKSLATINDFAGQSTLTRNLTGALGVGNSLLSIQAYGPTGAVLSWKFTTSKVIVSKVNPTSFGLNDKIVIEGQNFSDRPNVTQVFIDKVPAVVTSAKPNRLEIKAPANIQGNGGDLVVVVGPSRSNPIKVTVKSAPVITGISLLSCPAGQPITIYGEGFSSNIAENKVFIGDLPAAVTGCTPKTIDCVIPEPPGWWPAYNVPIKVVTNGVTAADPNNKATIMIQVRVF